MTRDFVSSASNRCRCLWCGLSPPSKKSSGGVPKDTVLLNFAIQCSDTAYGEQLSVVGLYKFANPVDP
jgi:hypothetical protein